MINKGSKASSGSGRPAWLRETTAAQPSASSSLPTPAALQQQVCRGPSRLCPPCVQPQCCGCHQSHGAPSSLPTPWLPAALSQLAVGQLRTKVRIPIAGDQQAAPQREHNLPCIQQPPSAKRRPHHGSQPTATSAAASQGHTRQTPGPMLSGHPAPERPGKALAICSLTQLLPSGYRSGLSAFACGSQEPGGVPANCPPHNVCQKL